VVVRISVVRVSVVSAMSAVGVYFDICDVWCSV
jgi:hypothetical protein